MKTWNGRRTTLETGRETCDGNDQATVRKGKDFSMTFRKGVSLTELLVTLLVTGIIMSAVIGLMYLFMTHFEFTSSGVSARQRAEMVLSVLAKPVSHAGLGMPVDPEEFEDAFEDIYDLEITTDEYPRALNTIDSHELYVVYGEPTGFSIIGPEGLDTDTVELNGDADNIAIGDWVVFPTGEMPFEVTAKPTNGLTLAGNGSLQDVALLDEVHLVRFLKVFVDDAGLHAIDPRSGGMDIIIEGIHSVEFDYDPDTDPSILEMILEGHGREGRREDIEEIKASWRIRNL